MAINKKNIVKNSFFLYVRMFLVMLCNFFVVRIVLKILGAEDYGINNVVGGVVTMLAFLSSTMNAASQRFFAFELGRQNLDGLKKYFTSSFWIYAGLVVFVILIAETLGLWFLQNKMTIPVDRSDAAFWVYQCSVISFVFSLLSIPYNAIIIAREKMNIYAYVGIIEVLLRLVSAYALYFVSVDLLKAYAFFSCVAMTLPSLFYIVWGTKFFPECHIIMFWNKRIFFEIASFSSWNIIGALSAVLRSQGINILLNIFFNPVVNAARAIAYQVYSAVNQFVMNFFKAVQPQIVKSYAADDRNSLLTLIYASTKFNFFLVYLIALPVLFETSTFLSIWLSNVPDYTVLFVRLVIINAIFDSTIYPLQTAIMATGNIKYYQIITGSLLLLVLPISYLFLKKGFPPEVTLYIALYISFIAQFVRIIFMKKRLFMPIREYFIKVALPIVVVGVLSCILPMLIQININEGLVKFYAICISSPVSVLLCSFFIGMTKNERTSFQNLLIQKVKKCSKK